MKHPVLAAHSEEQSRHLVTLSLNGDQSALDQLIRLHQPFIYNVAWKMTHDPNDAKDLTQETLIKIITKLAQFNFKSQFTTWLYRIVVNEFLQSKRRKTEKQFSSFDELGAGLDQIPNPDLTREEEIELAELSKEMQMKCMSGMLMCLTREQRLIYILGDTFGLDHNLGAAIFEISKENFRIKLHRARKDLYNYMNNKCGLVNKKNPCRCPKKAKAMKRLGMLDEKSMQFNLKTQTRIMDYVEEEYNNLRDSVEDKYTELFRSHKTREFDRKLIVQEILGDDDIMRHFNIN